MRRTQISLPQDRYEAARRIADRRGISLSEVFRKGLKCIEEQEQAHDRGYIERMMGIVGIVEDADPRSSVDHDKILYGWEDE